MLQTLRNAWKVPELRSRILWTLFFVAVFRLGHHIPVPGINTDVISQYTNQSGSLLSFYDLISGGALSNFSIFALGVVPYINSSIIMQLLTIAVPQLEQLSKEGEEGRRKIQNITRYAAIAIGFIQAYASYIIILNAGALEEESMLALGTILITLVAASTFLMWLGDQISVKGLGNGVSMLIFVNIISQMPTLAFNVISHVQNGEAKIVEAIVLVVFILALIFFAIVMNQSERKISVHYAGKAVGSKIYKGQTTHIPIGIISSAVIAVIFAMSVMQFPTTIAQFFPGSWFDRVIANGAYSPFKTNTFLYILLYAVLTMFFNWFYAQITFKPEEMAENMNKSAGFIPGIKPGRATAKYIEKIIDRISVIGGIAAVVIAISPILIDTLSPFQNLAFGGTSLLITIGFSMDVIKQLESQLVMRHYQGFLK